MSGCGCGRARALVSQARPVSKPDGTNSNVAQTSAPSNVSQTSASSNVSQTSASSNVSQTSASSNVSQTSASSNVSQTSAPSNVAQTSAPSNVAQTSAPSNVVQTSVPSNVVQTSVPSVPAVSRNVVRGSRNTVRVPTGKVLLNKNKAPVARKPVSYKVTTPAPNSVIRPQQNVQGSSKNAVIKGTVRRPVVYKRIEAPTGPTGKKN